ncbi:MAG: hypothetical protein E7403_07480 [Ruminococcaceae bacterium]|nr:hypothetical protein [Oscillospiraceae bacterium]
METKEIVLNKKFFEPLTFSHLSFSLKSYDNRDYFSSAVWAAVFIEALVKDILFYLDGKDHTEELNFLIKNLRTYIETDQAVSLEDKRLMKDMTGRCHEIRVKRNRLVHDTGVERGKIDMDAQDINNNVKQIVSQYLDTSVAQGIYKKNNADHLALMPEKEPTFPVFISTITPHTFEQLEFINSFSESLRAIGILPVRCELTDFDKKDPMKKVKETIEKCKAAIVIGLERSHVYYFKDKEGSREESENTHRKYTSSWLQIESGMAIALGKEVFVLCQKDIHSDGIFDRFWNSYPPIELESPLDVNSDNVQMMLRKIKEFAENCEKQ